MMQAPFIKNNPEFQKNCWLELNQTRLILMPVILALIFLLSSTISGREQMTMTLRYISLSAFVILTVLWGAKQVAESLMDEIKEKTWDWQIMSVISPRKMMLGKLFGSTIFQWYGGILSISFYLATFLLNNELILGLKLTLLNISFAVLAQSLSLMIGLMSMKNETVQKNKLFKSTFSFLGLIYLMSGMGVMNFVNSNSTNVPWFFIQFKSLDLALLTVVIFTFWAITGVERLMRAEFQFRNGLRAWLSFVAFISFYFLGFIVEIPNFDLAQKTLIFFGIVALSNLFLSSVTILFSSKEITMFRRMKKNFLSKNWLKFNADLAPWQMSAIIAVLNCLIVAFLSFFIEFEGNGIASGKIFQINFVIALMFFFLRDLTLILFSNLIYGKRGDSLAYVLLFLLYFVLPWIFETATFGSLWMLFLPFHKSMTNEIPFNFIFPMIQFLALLYFYVRKWQSLENEVNKT
ncbi:MAG: hypothetical protein SNJ77_09955 [Cytophagales bacterium]